MITNSLYFWSKVILDDTLPLNPFIDWQCGPRDRDGRETAVQAELQARGPGHQSLLRGQGRLRLRSLLQVSSLNEYL